MKALIFSGGEFSPSDNFNYGKYDLVICADKGMENIKKSGIKADVTVGDFDSIDIPENTSVIKFPAEKDVTDTEIAIEYAIEKGAEEIVILGGTGGRLDHTFANILLLYRTYKKGIDIKMCDGRNTCFVAGEKINIKKDDNRYLSIFPLFEDISGLDLSGVKYPLSKAHLPKDSSLCVSNEITEGEAEIKAESGTFLIILSNDR